MVDIYILNYTKVVHNKYESSMLLCLICMYGLMLLLLREIFDWLWLMRVSPCAALVIRGGGAPVRFLTHPCLVMSNDFGECADCRMAEHCSIVVGLSFSI